MSKQSFIKMLNLYSENQKLDFIHRRFEGLNERLKDWEAYKNDVSKISANVSLLELCDYEISVLKEEIDYIESLLIYE